jgi:hypothetical protein
MNETDDVNYENDEKLPIDSGKPDIVDSTEIIQNNSETPPPPTPHSY